MGVGVGVKAGVAVAAIVGFAVGVGLCPADTSATSPTESVNRTTSEIFRNFIFASPREHARSEEQVTFRIAHCAKRASERMLR